MTDSAIDPMYRPIYRTYNNGTHSMSVAIDRTNFCRYTNGMKTPSARRGRPPKTADRVKADYLDIRLGVAEKQAFRDAAELAGLDLSAWVRERLRSAARKELEAASLPVAFLAKATVDRSAERG
jgi:uncharacterized protein (DUF1778 family)